MSSTFGKIIQISLFGESHSKCVGLTINGLRSGIKIDEDLINKDLSLRKTNDALSTTRNEIDKIEFLSGVFNGFTTGSPLTFIIKNSDVDSSNYNQDFIRPSHSDLTSKIKYQSFNDYRGGGHFSGRLTTPLIVLGSICKQELQQMNIYVGTHIYNIDGIQDDNFDYTVSQIQNLNDSNFPVISSEKKELMKEKILMTKENNDSIGGSLETIIYNLPIGIGEPFFDSLESMITHLIFSIGGVKGILFGEGINFAYKKGSEVNEILTYEQGYKYKTNYNGGILGGISNGQPVIFRTIVKPTPTYSLPMQTINNRTKENVCHSFIGRYDPCIVHRISKVIDALTYYCIYEMILQNRSNKWNMD